MPFSVLVTGANRGIGLELVKQLAIASQLKTADHIFATCRHPDDAKDLKVLQEQHSQVHVLQLDVCDEDSYTALVRRVSDTVQDSGLNLLINNAATAGIHGVNDVTSKEMHSMYGSNTVAPLMLTKALLPLLRMAATAADGGDSMSYARAAVLNISSRVASLEDNRSGRMYAYRASKAALNSVTRCLGIDLRAEHILVVSMDPGWVKTRMGGPNAKIAPEESATRILTALSGLTAEHTSTYLDHFGKPIPW